MGMPTNLVEEFYAEEGHKYDITLEECKLICLAPFKLVREIFSRGILRDIRLQYFGVFEVVSGRVTHSLKNLEESYSKGNISEERYNRRKTILSNYENRKI